MAVRTGLGAQFGMKTETTWGTAVTVDRFFPLVSEGIGGGPEPLYGEGIIAGRLTHDTNNVTYGNETYRGDLAFELYDHSIGLLFKHMLGAVATSGSGPYTHTYTPGEPLPSFTAQIGVPDVSGTVRAKTYAGTMIESWEMACEAGKIVTLGTTVSAKSEATATALAVASYASNLIPVKFSHAALSLYGSAVNCKSIKLRGDNKLTYDERRFLGASTIGAIQVSQDMRSYEGDAMLELEDNFVQYARFKAGTAGALSLVFTVGSNTVTVTENIRLTGETPKVGGRGIVDQPLKFEAFGTTDAAAITIVSVNSDSTP